MAAYTQCLRCAGAPKRPASGSGLSLLIPSWHAVLSDPGESDIDIQKLRCRHWPSPNDHRLGTPITPAIRSTRAVDFVASLVRLRYGLPGCSPPVRIRLERPAFEDFYFQASNGSVALPAAGYDYNSDWTPLLAGLSPAGMAASLAARSFSTEARTSVGPAMSAMPLKAEGIGPVRDPEL